MKRIVISAVIALSAAAAHADPVTVIAPKAGATAEEKAVYLEKLDDAVKDVCRDEASPIVGVNFYVYLQCVKHTRREVGKSEPTGLYAAREPLSGTVVAAK